MRGWKGSRETRLLTICHSCHGCLLLSFLSCRDANSGLGGQSSISEENGLFIHCHRVARYALHWNLACDLHCATKLLKISCFHPLQVTVCWGHHMYALWTPRWQFDNIQFTRQGHAEVMVSNFFTPYYNFPFLPSFISSLSFSSFLSHALYFALSLLLSLSSTFSSVCSAPRAVFTDVPYVPCLHSIQAVCLIWQLWDSHWECLRSYRAVLALHAGAVEAQRRDAVADTLHVHHALVAPLARLRLGKVSGPQGDGSDLTGRNENFPWVKELRAVLWKKKSLISCFPCCYILILPSGIFMTSFP